MTKPELTDTSQYAESGVDSGKAEGALGSLLNHVLPTRKFNERYPLAAIRARFLTNDDIHSYRIAAMAIAIEKIHNSYRTMGVYP